MESTAMGWRPHSGWAIAVMLRTPASSPTVLERQRVQLVDDATPRMAFHAIEQLGLTLDEGAELIASVEAAATESAVAAIEGAVAQFDVQAVGVVGKVRRVPDDLARILASHALLHAS